jgi:hypothetical protein
MKAKLKKTSDGYELHKLDEESNLYMPVAYLPRRASCRMYYISQQNCDSLFGVVDVEKLASDYANKRLNEEYSSSAGNFQAFSSSFRDGFNKAMELNKENTRRVVYEIMNHIGEEYQGAFMDSQGLELIRIKEKYFESDRTLESFLEPTEIEVMIVMEDVKYFRMAQRPKLDSEGNLILKKL